MSIIDVCSVLVSNAVMYQFTTKPFIAVKIVIHFLFVFPKKVVIYCNTKLNIEAFFI